MKKLFAALIFLFSFCQIIHAEEYIDTYHVDITILNNGNISVTENIKVWAEGKDIKRGIYRWFSLKNVEKYQRDVPYMNLRTTRNGQPEKIGKTERNSNSIAYYFGDKDVFVETNTFHEYAISYEVDKAILQFDESDQLYWNIIPFFWEFPISNISAKVKFPENANYLGIDVFSGSFGSEKNKLNVSYSETTDGISFQGTVFKSKQGLTARIKFEPSLVPASENYPVINDAYRKMENDATERRPKLNPKYVGLFAGFSFFALCITVLTWFKLGREANVVGTVIPQFYPPKGISPLAARYILRQGNVDGLRMITIALVSMVTKGIVEVSDTTVELLGRKNTNALKDNTQITKGEQLLLKEMGLNDIGDTFIIQKNDQSFARKVNQIGRKLTKFAKEEFCEHVSNNLKARLFLSLPIVGTIFFGFKYIDPAMILFLIPTVAYFFNFPGLFYFWKGYLICTLAFPGMAGILLSILNYKIPELLDIVVLFGGLLLIVNFYIIYKELKNYSSSGGSILTKLEGLRMYIKAAEAASLSEEPLPSAKQFSDVYPYAFAMGLNTIWASRFANQLSIWQGSKNPVVSWYVSGDLGSFENSSSSFDSALRAAANYNSPSSGGGGGGGGGGW